MQTSLVDEVARRLRQMIETGSLAAGDRLPSEPELVERLQVSRTVLREAISRLETIGLLNVRRGRGTYVGDRGSLAATTQLLRSAMAISTHDLRKVSELRRSIETYCGRRAAELATGNDIAELRELYANMMAARGNLPESMRLDFRFHLRIVEIAGNDLMRNILEVIQEFVFAGMIQTLEQPGLPQPAHDQHREILDAIAAHDPARAELAVGAHMDLIDARLQFVEKQKLGMSE
jgi:GntR family transcriptional regulator, transcriptional repressor for pyruvate dehydrogenase complex